MMTKYSKTSDGKWEATDTTFLDGVLGSYTNVVTGVPATQAQSIILGTSCLATGVLLSALVFSRNKKKYAWYASLADGKDSAAI